MGISELRERTGTECDGRTIVGVLHQGLFSPGERDLRDLPGGVDIPKCVVRGNEHDAGMNIRLHQRHRLLVMANGFFMPVLPET